MHQRKRRGLDDTRVGGVEVVRYRCKACRKTFTVRPEGVTRSSKSLRVQALCVLFWCLGLSYDRIVAVLEVLGVPIAKSTVYNYVQRAGREAMRLRRGALRGEIRIVGMDTTVYKVKGRRTIAAYITDAVGGGTIAIEFLRHEDAESLTKCLKKAVNGPIDLLITDDAEAYKEVAESAGARHQLCQTHFKKAFVRRVKKILADVPQKDKSIRKDLEELGKHVRRGKPLSVRLLTRAKRLFPKYLDARPPRKGEKASPEYRVRLLLTKLVDYGANLFSHREFKDGLLDGTNNVTERAIGLDGKVRYRAMRGAKSRRSLRRVLNLHAYMRGHRLDNHTPLDMTRLIA